MSLRSQIRGICRRRWVHLHQFPSKGLLQTADWLVVQGGRPRPEAHGVRRQKASRTVHKGETQEDFFLVAYLPPDVPICVCTYRKRTSYECSWLGPLQVLQQWCSGLTAGVSTVSFPCEISIIIFDYWHRRSGILKIPPILNTLLARSIPIQHWLRWFRLSQLWLMLVSTIQFRLQVLICHWLRV